MHELLVQLKGVRQKKQLCRATTRRLVNEYRLLKAKLICMAGAAQADDETLDTAAQTAFKSALQVLVKTDLDVVNVRQKKEKHDSDWRKQSVILMHFIYAKYNTEQDLRKALRL